MRREGRDFRIRLFVEFLREVSRSLSSLRVDVKYL